MRLLSVLEARVVGVLVEKALTVPDSYPLSLNALTLGCAQKTARDPVLAVGEAEVQAAVDAVKGLNLVLESSGSRVSRYQHNLGRALGLPSQSVVLLATLMLRGPQTASELRANSERLHRFADLSSVEGFLDELANRPADKGGALALKLARVPGSREARWIHLLSPVPTRWTQDSEAPADDVVPLGELAALKAEQRLLHREVSELRRLVDRLYRELEIALEVAPDPGATGADGNAGHE